MGIGAFLQEQVKIVVLRLPGHMIAYVVFSFHKASEE